MILEPQHDCPLCPRLVSFREDNRENYPDFFNAPVPSFGRADARLLIVGLAPGLKGANRTGRPFTGDFAGDLQRAPEPRAQRRNARWRSLAHRISLGSATPNTRMTPQAVLR